MGQDKKRPDLGLTEPEIVDCTLLTGALPTVKDGVVHVVGWTEIPETGEQRIKRRSAMDIENAEKFYRDLGEALAKARGHGEVPN